MDLRVKINLYFSCANIVDNQNCHVRRKQSTSPNANWISPLRSSCRADKRARLIMKYVLARGKPDISVFIFKIGFEPIVSASLDVFELTFPP
jgi:hypothetical protein